MPCYLRLGAHADGDVVVGVHDPAVGQEMLADLDDAAVAEGALDNAALGPGEDGEAALHESLLAAGGRDLLGRVVPLGQSLADVFRKVDAGAAELFRKAEAYEESLVQPIGRED